jgi:hypothetical protein
MGLPKRFVLFNSDQFKIDIAVSYQNNKEKLHVKRACRISSDRWAVDGVAYIIYTETTSPSPLTTGRDDERVRGNHIM